MCCRQIGNAVCPPVVQSIGANMLRVLEGRHHGSTAGHAGGEGGEGGEEDGAQGVRVYTPAGGVEASV